MQRNNPFFHRISQLIGFLLGARFFVAALLTFALYVSTFFLFNQEDGLRKFVFDFRVHAIIFCAVLSILAGGIINQFYDMDKDLLIKPFRTRLQRFIKQKYYLYAYLALSIISLVISWLLSPRVFLFFLIYQFLMWLYSHKLSRLLVLNNLTFVALTMYPFFGMLIYYRHFSRMMLLMAIFLFLMLLIIDLVKDFLTKNADKVFGYVTIPNFFGSAISKRIVVLLSVCLMATAAVLASRFGLQLVLGWYFMLSPVVVIICSLMLFSKNKNFRFYVLNIMRLWIFVGILSMLADGLIARF